MGIHLLAVTVSAWLVLKAPTRLATTQTAKCASQALTRTRLHRAASRALLALRLIWQAPAPTAAAQTVTPATIPTQAHLGAPSAAAGPTLLTAPIAAACVRLASGRMMAPVIVSRALQADIRQRTTQRATLRKMRAPLVKTDVTQRRMPTSALAAAQALTTTNRPTRAPTVVLVNTLRQVEMGRTLVQRVRQAATLQRGPPAAWSARQELTRAQGALIVLLAQLAQRQKPDHLAALSALLARTQQRTPRQLARPAAVELTQRAQALPAALRVLLDLRPVLRAQHRAPLARHAMLATQRQKARAAAVNVNLASMPQNPIHHTVKRARRARTLTNLERFIAASAPLASTPWMSSPQLALSAPQASLQTQLGLNVAPTAQKARLQKKAPQRAKTRSAAPMEPGTNHLHATRVRTTMSRAAKDVLRGST